MKLWSRLTNRGRYGSCALGVQFGSASLRIVALERQRRGFRLQYCHESFFPDGIRFGGHFDPAIKAACIRMLRAFLDTIGPQAQTAIIGLDSRGVLVRTIPVDPWLEEEALQDQMAWEAEQLVVEPLDQFVVDYDIQKVNEMNREAVLALVRKSILDDYIEIAEKAGLRAACLDVDLFGLSNAFEHMARDRADGPVVLLDVESECLRCVLVHNGIFCFGRSLRTSSPCGDVEKVLQTALCHCPAIGQETAWKRIVVSGDQALCDTVVQDLNSQPGPAVETAFPFQDVKAGPLLPQEQRRENAAAFLVSFGLALRGVTEP